jgi:hypothetical protein
LSHFSIEEYAVLRCVLKIGNNEKLCISQWLNGDDIFCVAGNMSHMLYVVEKNVLAKNGLAGIFVFMARAHELHISQTNNSILAINCGRDGMFHIFGYNGIGILRQNLLFMPHWESFNSFFIVYCAQNGRVLFVFLG